MKPQIAHASVHPHDHLYEQGGPLDVSIGALQQPPVVRNWPRGTPLQVALEQPNEDDNTTLLRVLFRKRHTPWPPGYKALDLHWYNANQWRMKGGILRVRIKNRVARTMTHPIPVGKWIGTLESSSTWACYCLQARTLVAQPVEPPRSIIVPGDPDYELAKRAAQTVHRPDGMDR